MKGVILDSNGDFALEAGRIELGDSSLQTADNIIRANRGEFKEAPLIGGEVLKMQGGQINRAWCVDVKKMIKSAGVEVSAVTMDSNEIIVKL